MCLSMHLRRRLDNFCGKTIDHLVINRTNHASVVMAGRMIGENSCMGAHYEDHKGHWVDVIAHVALEITLQQS